MTDTVDLQVVGKEGDISRAEMTQLLVDEFKQSGSAFENLLDAAFGESGPYAAQSSVDIAMAEEGMQQLRKLGLVCRLVEAGTNNEVGASVTDIGESPSVTDVTEQASIGDSAELDLSEEASSLDVEETDTASAAEFDLDELEFDDTPVEDGKDAVASVRKMDSTLEKDADLEFTDELETVKNEDNSENGESVKKIESKLDANKETLEFSDEFDSQDDSGGASGISAAKKQDKPAADSTAAVDFSESVDDGVAPMLSKKAARKSRGDVPDALSETSFDDLEADLIDPAPAEKAEKKEPVELDDGGLSLSDDDSAPLTQPKSKSDSVADDGGLSLEDDSSADNKSSDSDALPADTEIKAEAPVADITGAVANDKKDELSQAAADLQLPADDSTESDKPEALNLDADDAPDLGAIAEETPETPETLELNDSPEIEDVPASIQAAPEEESSAAEDTASEGDALGNLLSDLNTKVSPAVGVVANSDEPASNEGTESADSIDGSNKDAPAEVKTSATDAAPIADSVKPETDAPKVPEAKPAGLVLAGQINPAVMPSITREEDLGEVASTVPSIDEIDQQAAVSSGDSKAPEDSTESAASAKADKKKAANVAVKKPGKTKKLVAAFAGIAVLGGAGTFAFNNAGSLSIPMSDSHILTAADSTSVKDSDQEVNQVQIETGDISSEDDLEQLSTGELLVNLSVSSNASSIVELEPYFLESVNRARSGPRFGAAVPADSNSMTGRVPHPADEYFDAWSNREADLSLFLALLDTLINKGELDVAQQLSDRAKDKLFAVLSAQRLARAYSETGDNDAVSRLMADAARDTFSIKDAEERVLAISDFGLTEQALGLNEDAMDTFLTTSILARSLTKPERKTVGLSSAARYFHRSGREKDAQKLLAEALEAGMQLPDNTAARDLAIRFVALTEARMGLFNQAIEHTKLITDPVAAVSSFHGVALAIESTGDDTNARKILNMAYRTGSKISNKEERTKLLDKVVLASESE